MSPWTESRRPLWPLYVGVALVVLSFVTGGLLMTGVVDGDDESDEQGRPPVSVPTGALTAAPGETEEAEEPGSPAPMLEVVSWGRASDQLAVVVRNASQAHLARARVRITARDSGGGVVLSTAGSPTDVCCTVVGLPPGKNFGLFAYIDPDVLDVATVEVETVAAETSQVGAGGEVIVEDARLERYADDTVATATLVARGPVSGYVAAQAILVDDAGDVVQVISGRFYCFEPGRPRLIRLRLFRAVPDGLRLGPVLAYPIPAGVPAHVKRRCS